MIASDLPGGGSFRRETFALLSLIARSWEASGKQTDASL
jgi:hypothetical protein